MPPGKRATLEDYPEHHHGFPDEFRVERKAVTLRTTVTDKIRNAIALGYFKPGERLPERALCEMTDVSRTLVREALRQLESERIIEIVPHRGPAVARLDRNEVIGLYQVRRQLESLGVQLFIDNASQEDMTRLRAALDEIRAASQSDDQIRRIKAKNLFYAALIEGAHNKSLGACLDLLNSQIILLRARSLRSPGRMQKSIEELEELVAAIFRRDRETAGELAILHVTNAEAEALAHFDDVDPPRR